MKKYISLIAIALTAALPMRAQYLFTQQEHKQLSAQVERTVAAKTQIESTITVQIPITKQFFLNPQEAPEDFADSAEYRSRRRVPTYPSTVGCKAYALDDHWLIAGAACLWNGRHQIPINGKKCETGLVEEDFSKVYLQAKGAPIRMEDNLFVQPRFTLLPHFLLVRIPQDSSVAATVKAMPKVNILGTIQSNPAKRKGSFYVNTSRFGLDAARLRKIKSYDFIHNTVSIEESLDDLAALSNDPLLYVEDGKVYWMGINSGVMRTYPNKKWDGLPSKNFVLFDNSDLDFIQRIIEEQDPAAWQRIAPRLHRDTIR